MSDQHNFNPHALSHAQDDYELFEVMMCPPCHDDETPFDIYKDKPISAGIMKPRAEVHRDRNWHRSVHVWVVDRFQKKVVLQQRSATKDTFPNRWDISAAGHIEAFSESVESAIRELAEELGLSATESELAFIFTIPAAQAELGGCNCFEDVYVLLRTESETNFHVGEAEVSAVRWESWDTLRRRLNEEHNDEYVPRTAKYTEALFAYFDTLQ